MFQTGGERCPVALLRQYINRRRRNLRASRLFYLSIKYNSGPGDETWYKIQPMGENKTNSMMKNIISQTTLRSFEKQFTNHSACKTLVNKMKKANLERSSIAKTTVFPGPVSEAEIHIKYNIKAVNIYDLLEKQVRKIMANI